MTADCRLTDMSLDKLQTLFETFDEFPDPADRTDMLLSYADQFKEVPPEVATRPFPEKNHIPQCESDAYIWALKQPDSTLKLHFAVENPSGHLGARARDDPRQDALRPSRRRDRHGRLRHRRTHLPAQHLDGQRHGADGDGGRRADAGETSELVAIGFQLPASSFRLSFQLAVLFLPKRQIEPAWTGPGGAVPGRILRHAVKAQARRTPHHDDVARLQHQRLCRLVARESADDESSGVAERHRHNRHACLERLSSTRPCPGARPSGCPDRSSS